MRSEYEANIKKEILSGFYEEEIQDVELQQSQLRNTEKSKVDLLKQLEDKLREIKQEISCLG
jgi:flagellar hook-associated protein FlgK